MKKRLEVGMHVHVPWGFEDDREASIFEIWGEPENPSHVRVELLPIGDEDERILLLLSPNLLTPLSAV